METKAANLYQLAPQQFSFLNLEKQSGMSLPPSQATHCGPLRESITAISTSTDT